MSERLRGALLLVVAAGLLFGSLACFAAASARAAEPYVPPEGEPALEAPECPEASAEVVYSEEMASVCHMERYLLGEIARRGYWSAAEVKGVKEGVQTLDERPAGGAGGSAGVVEAVSADTEAVESSGLRSLQAIYILVGVVLGMFVLSLLREILRRAG